LHVTGFFVPFHLARVENILVAEYISRSYKFHIKFCLHMNAFLLFDSLIVMKSIVQAEIKTL